MKIHIEGDPGFEKALGKLDNRMDIGEAAEAAGVAASIIADVRKKGDKALFAYTDKFDKISLNAKTVRLPQEIVDEMSRQAAPDALKALKTSAARIRNFHKRQMEKSWSFKEPGAVLGQVVRPIESVGIYVPGGKASYPSTALMNAIPAKLAGVKRVVMVSPTPGGEVNPYTIAAAKIAGVDEIYRIGGAQAVAALAYGTKSVKPVDKIVGPGNVYVAEAKRQVFGKVDIDMIAGPSEILVIADHTARADVIAADLLSQAEHDENAYAILVTTQGALADQVARELAEQAKSLPRKAIIDKCLKKNCYAFVTKDLAGAADISNRIGPEHLELLVQKPADLAKKITNAGAMFIGKWTPEALGDYSAGPNHVLPTGGTARFFSPLGVYDFLKRTSYLSFNRAGLSQLAASVTDVARVEGLEAHARAVEIRLKK